MEKQFIHPNAKVYRVYTVYANYLPTPIEIYMDDVRFEKILAEPDFNFVDNEDFSYTKYSNACSVSDGNEITSDGIFGKGDSFDGLPFGMTKNDIITRYKLNAINEIKDAVKSDKFVKVKDNITVNVSCDKNFNPNEIAKSINEAISKGVEDFRTR